MTVPLLCAHQNISRGYTVLRALFLEGHQQTGAWPGEGDPSGEGLSLTPLNGGCGPGEKEGGRKNLVSLTSCI